MMPAVDRALAALLRRDVLGEAVDVSIEAPNRPWTAAVTTPTVNLFLFDVRENLARREVMVEPVRDRTGTIVARRPPPARYDLFYVLSAWGCPAELEHQILAAAVACLGSYDVVPPELLGDAATPHGCFLTTAPGMKRGMMPSFSGEMKIQVDLSVTTPLVLPTVGVAGPPVREPARLTVRASTPEEIAEVRRNGARLPAARTADSDPFAVTRTALAAAVEALPPPKPAGPPPGGPAQGQRPPGAAPPGQQRPAGAPAGQGPPAQRAPGQRPPGQRPPGAPAGPPPSPLAVLKVALTQAAQAQAALAQAVTAVAALLPAPAAAPQQPPAADPSAAASPPVQAQQPASAPAAPPRTAPAPKAAQQAAPKPAPDSAG